MSKKKSEPSKTQAKVQPHIKLSKSSHYERVIVCGAPERAEMIATTHLKDVELVAKNREYHSYLGTYKGVKVLVTSHGVGAAGAMICFQELIQVGAQYILRLGTAGGLYPNTKIGDIVVADSAIRMEGVSSLMVPTAYPAVPDQASSLKLYDEVKKSGLNVRMGTVLTTDLFYTELLDNQLEFYSKANTQAVEMESAALFVVGRLKGIKTAGVFALDGNPLEKNHYDPHGDKMRESVATLAKAAVKAIVKF